MQVNIQIRIQVCVLSVLVYIVEAMNLAETMQGTEAIVIWGIAAYSEYRWCSKIL